MGPLKLVTVLVTGSPTAGAAASTVVVAALATGPTTAATGAATAARGAVAEARGADGSAEEVVDGAVPVSDCVGVSVATTGASADAGRAPTPDGGAPAGIEPDEFVDGAGREVDRARTEAVACDIGAAGATSTGPAPVASVTPAPVGGLALEAGGMMLPSEAAAAEAEVAKATAMRNPTPQAKSAKTA